MSKLRLFALSLGVLQSLAGMAQAQEAEPNDGCPGQGMGTPMLPFTVEGSLTTPPKIPDVDFFRFDLPPGAELVADLEGLSTDAGTLADPLLGLFDSACNLINVDDDGGAEVNARLTFVVPEDGVVTLAAASYPDFSFSGDGSGPGTYRLSIGDAPPLIGSISGRLVDARDGVPLTGDEPVYAYVVARYCVDGDCQDVASAVPDAQGHFTFSGALYGLRAGEYRLAAIAAGYDEDGWQVSETFQVAGGEDYQFGDFALEPNEIQITRMRSCDPIPSDGGVCAYSLDLRNGGDEPFSGRVWSLVEYYAPAQSFFYAFQVGSGKIQNPKPKYVWLEPGETERVSFYLPVPPEWDALDGGGYACLSVGIGRAPFAVHKGVIAVSLGCLARDTGGFRMLSPDQVDTELKAQSVKPLGTSDMRQRFGLRPGTSGLPLPR